MDTQRASFALDIPADGTPAFGITAYDPADGKGGLVWRVRMNFLVAVAPALPSSGQGGGREEVIKSLVRDGPRGEWGSSLHAGETLAPLGKVETLPGTNTQGKSGDHLPIPLVCCSRDTVRWWRMDVYVVWEFFICFFSDVIDY